MPGASDTALSPLDVTLSDSSDTGPSDSVVYLVATTANQLSANQIKYSR